MYNNDVKQYGGFHPVSQNPIDDRLVLAKEDLVKILPGAFSQEGWSNKFDLNRFPDNYFAVVTDSEGNSQLYILDKAGSFADSEDSHLGYFHRVDYNYIKAHPYINNIEIEGSHNAHYYLLQGLLHSSEGLYVDDSELRLLFDHKTLVIDDNGNLSVPIDNHTIVVNSEGKLEAAALPLRDGVATEIVSSEGYNFVNVLFDNETIALNSEGKLMATTQLFADKAIEITSEGKISALFDGTIFLDSENQMHVFHDQKSIKLGSEGLYVNLSDGKATKLNTSEEVYGVDVLVDDETIKINASNDLEVKLDKAIVKDSEGLSVNVDDKTIKVVNNKLEAQYKAGKALELTNSEVFNVLFDSEDLELDAQNRLKLVEKPKHKVEDGVATHVYYLNTADSELTVDVLHDDKTIKVGSEGLFVDLDGKTLVQDANHVRVNIDDDTLYFSDSEGVLKAKLEAIVAGHAMKIDSTTHVADVIYDDETIKEDSEKQLYVNVDSETIIMDVDHLKVNLDGTSVKYDTSEGYIRVNADGKTILYKDDITGQPIPLTTRIGGWRSDKRVTKQLDLFTAPTVSAFEVPHVPEFFPEIGDEMTFVVSYTDRGRPDSTTETYTVSYIDDTHVGYVEQGSGLSFFDSVIFDRTTGEVTYTLDPVGTGGLINLSLNAKAGSYEYHPIDARYVPVDGSSIIAVADDNNVYTLKATAKDLFDGVATHINGNNEIDVLFDGKTIVLDSSEGLVAPLELPDYSSEGDKFLYVNSEGKLEWSHAGQVDDVTNEDGDSFVVDKVAIVPNSKPDKYGLAKFDNDTIVLNSENQLSVVNLVEDVFVLDCEGMSSVVDSERHAIIDLRDYSTIANTGRSLEMMFDSEFNVLINMLNAYDSEISSAKINIPIAHALVDAKYVDDGLMPSEGEPVGGAMVFKLATGEELEVRLDELVAGLVTKLGKQVIKGEKDFQGGLYKNTLEVLSVANIDNKTIVWNSEEAWIETRTTVISEGDAIEVLDGGFDPDGFPISIINVLRDDETIKLDSENSLYVPLGSALEFNSSEDAVRVVVDDKTIKVKDNALFVNVDGVTVFYDDSEGYLKANAITARPGDAIKITTSDSESTEDETIQYIDVLFDDKTIHLNADNQLELHLDSDRAIDVSSEGELFVKVDNLTINFNSAGELVATALKDGVATEVEMDDEGYSHVNVLFDSEKALSVDSENRLFIKVDDVTVKFNSEGELVAMGMLPGEANEFVESEGLNIINVLYDDVTIKLGDDNHLYLPIDSETIYVSSEGLLKARPEPLQSGVATDVYYNSEGSEVVDVIFDTPLYINSEGELCVGYDHTTIVLDSEDQLHVAIDEKSLYYNDSEQAIKVNTLTNDDILRICWD